MREWLRTRDPGLAALRRAGRAALVMPALFAVGDKLLANAALATFAAFGSFAMLLMVDFAGPLKARLLDQAALGAACAGLIAVATLCSHPAWLAAVAMAVVAFAVLFSAVVSSVLAAATTPLLLAFILPLSLPAPPSAIPDRVAGWALAAAVSLPAIALLWPAPERNPVRAAASAAARALAERLRGRREADEAVDAMETAFFATPYRPGGLSTEARAVVRVVEELRSLHAVAGRARPAWSGHGTARVHAVKQAAATVLERAADRLDQRENSHAALAAAVDELRSELRTLQQAAVLTVGDGSPQGVVSALDPSFRARELGFVAARIAADADVAGVAFARSWPQRLLGHRPALARPFVAARERAGAHLTWASYTLRTSVRGGVALALSVLVAQLTSAEHGFWVVLGTLAVLRSNALSTGENLARALGGTAVGFAIGGLLVSLVGTDTTALWALLPAAILLAGLAPSAISFAAGQAAFTLTLLILFNLLAPEGLRIGLVRIEDVALGGAVSVAVGLLFWPRGAGVAWRRALADAYGSAAQHLAEAVAYGLGRCDAAVPHTAPPLQQGLEADAAAQRLDDAFRGYLGEQGAKAAPLAELARLVTGVTSVHLAADGVLALWTGDSIESDRAAARDQLLRSTEEVTGWFEGLAAGVVGSEPVPAPPRADDDAATRLASAVELDLRDHDDVATATAVRVIWTGDHVDAIRRLQGTLVAPAAGLARRSRRPAARPAAVRVASWS